MNANQIINMVVRMVVRRVLRSGVNASINAVGNRMSKGKQANSAEDARANHQSGPDTRKTTQRAKKALRAGRRLSRF
ncbi:hypothetical protein [Roseovarius aestuariivivens]|uniref:hypothetical protein n=1 Tax=Roseovarius aestuariivivens TaxID=1888910 RepID=UPI0010815FE2|nr:hypothetical protein [Roseovarius aestuariivivens]